MIEIICGEKGKGKTKELLGKVNASVQTANGNVVYLDKSQKHISWARPIVSLQIQVVFQMKHIIQPFMICI